MSVPTFPVFVSQKATCTLTGVELVAAVPLTAGVGTITSSGTTVTGSGTSFLSTAVVGGAIGNLLDRIRLRDGVVDFIDIGFGDVRFWTFNVADTAVTLGAGCLIIALWQLDKAQQQTTPS